MVVIKLTNFLQLNKLLYKHQYGFQRGLSTEQNLISVTNFKGNALNNGNYCIGVFLDLRKAFDTCSHNILLTKLSKLGVNGIALQWFHSYLTGRHQKVDVNGCISSSAPIDCGIFQSSILVPCYFFATYEVCSESNAPVEITSIRIILEARLFQIFLRPV
jgi:hypothetical protein